MAFKLPDLPYDYDALEPHMSARTLEFHHDKHHKAYVDKLNKAVEDSKLADLTLEEIILKTADDESKSGVFNNAAQTWNHTFFWHSLSPDGGGKPEGELAQQIERDFGSYKDFTEKFSEAATGQFGSGWAWLVIEGGKLAVTGTPNAVPPMIHGQKALLTCDVWEHAYYLDYQNRRPEFVSKFLEEMVDWDSVAQRFALQGEGDYAAAARYRDDQEGFAKSGDVSGSAKAAREALDSDEGAQLERARRESGKLAS